MIFRPQHILIAWLGLWMISRWIISGAINIQIGKESATITNKQISKQHKTIENIQGELYTTPDIGEKWIEVVWKTRNQLMGEIYNITEKRVQKLLKEKAEQKTNLKIVMEDKQYKQYRAYFKELKNSLASYPNVILQNDQKMKTNYVHAKFFITDTHSIIQTANLTHAWLFNNKEHMFVTEDEKIRESLTKIIQKDLEGKAITTDDIHPNLVVCAINCRTIIETLLQGANKSIVIETQYITDPAIIKILQGQTKKTDIKIIVANTSENDDLRYQLANTIWKKYWAKEYLHTKTMLIDDKILLIGSMNLSTNSLDKNREVGIMITEPKLIEQFKKAFFYDRSL